MYREIINKFFPKLEITSYDLNTDGWESDVVIINNELVFKFPKEGNRYDCVFEKEKIITDKIRPYISTEISNIEIFKKKDIEFAKLKLIKGVDYYKSKPNIAEPLANFLKELHSIDIKPLKKYNLDARNLPFYKYRLDLTNFQFNYDNLTPFLKEYKFENDFNNTISTFANFEYKDEDDVLCHNDLHKGNIMVNDGTISGIIDFGDAIYTNYNIEFISIFKWNEKIIIDIKEKYEELTGRELNIDFIISVLRLFNYVKISNNIGDFNKNIRRFELLNTLSEAFKNKSEENIKKLESLYESDQTLKKI